MKKKIIIVCVAAALLLTAGVLAWTLRWYSIAEGTPGPFISGSGTADISDDHTDTDAIEPPAPARSPQLIVDEDISFMVGSDWKIMSEHEGAGTLSYETSDEDIVTVNDDGLLHGVRPGHALARVRVSAAGEYKEESAIIDITVNAPDIQKSIFLTFDDGPSENVTPELLDTLKEHGVHATFFVIGKYAMLYPDIVKRAYDEGHTIAIHTYTHDYREIYASTEAYIEDFDETEALIEEITGEKPRFWRFPGGGNNGYASHDRQVEILDTLNARGYTAMDWTVSSTDAAPNYPGAEIMYEKCTEGIDMMLSAGRTPVVLMHDSEVKVSAPEVAGRLIEHYEQLGYNFRPLSDYYGDNITFIKK